MGTGTGRLVMIGVIARGVKITVGELENKATSRAGTRDAAQQKQSKQ